MRLPKHWGQILRGASNCGHGKSLSIFVIGVVEVVLAFSKVDELKFVVGQ